MVTLTPEIVQELESLGDQPLCVEDPDTRRRYLVVDAERYDVVRKRSSASPSGVTWSEQKNNRRIELIRKKFSHGIVDEESQELAALQEELADYRASVVPLPYDIVGELQAAVNSGPPLAP